MRRVVAVRVVVLGCFFLITGIYAVTCPEGTFISKSSGLTCKKCPNGTYSNTVNTTKCLQCDECRGKHNLVTQACNLTSNTVCKCVPGYYFYDKVLFCLKCKACRKGSGVKRNCTSNSNTVCQTCLKGITYSNTKDLTSCKPCTKCRRGDTIRQECTRKNDSVCERESNDSKVKAIPVFSNSPTMPTRSKSPLPSKNRSWVTSTTANRRTPKSVRRTAGQLQDRSLIIALGVLLFLFVVVSTAFIVVVCRCTSRRRAKSLPKAEVAERGTPKTTLTVAQENAYSSLPVVGARQGAEKMLRNVPYTLINDLAKYLNPGSRWKALGGHLEFNNTEISNFGLVKENATQVMLEEWGQRECATVAYLMKTFAAMNYQKEAKICAEYV